MKTIYLILLAMLTACGTDPSKTIETAADPTQPALAGSQGPAGPQGPKGDKGDTGSTGASGAAGTAGAAGATGAAGQRGVAGGLALLNAQDVQVGIIIDPMGASTVVLPDGGFFATSLYDGSYYGTSGFDGTTSNTVPTCAFTTTNCTGVCYLVNAVIGNDLNPIPNSVVWDGTTLWRFSGDEIQTSGQLSTHSYWRMASSPQNTCVTANNLIDMSWPLSHAETLPEGVTFPFGRLHFVPEQ